MSQACQLRKYGVEATIDFEVYEVDGVDLRTDWTPAQADCEIMKDGGASTMCTNTATDEGSTYSIVLTATEMQAARLVLKVVDSATKVFLDRIVVIETYGNASAQHAMDLDDAVRGGLTALPNAAAGATSGLAVRGGAIPDASADAAGGLPVSDAGGLDIDALLGTLTSLAAATRNANVLDRFKTLCAVMETHRGAHSYQPIGEVFFLDPVNGATHGSGARGGITDPYLTAQDVEDNAVTDSNHDLVIMLAGAAAGVTTHTVAATTTLAKRYTFWRGPGRDYIWTRSGNGDTIAIDGDGIEISGCQIGTAGTGSGNGVTITDADFVVVRKCWILDTRGDGIHILRGTNCRVTDNHFEGTGAAASGQGIHIVGTAGSSNSTIICGNHISNTAGDSILIEDGTTNDTEILHNTIHDSAAWAVNIGASSTDAQVHDNFFGNNASGNINDGGTTSIIANNEQWAKHSIATEARLAELDAANLPADVDTLLTRVPQTLNLTASGNVGIDWANVENPTTALDLSATDIQLCDTITTYTSNTPQSGDAFAYLGTNLGAIGANATEAGGTGDHLTAINLPNQTMDIVGDITGNLSGSVGSVTGAVGSVTGAVGSVTGNVGGNVTGSVGSLAAQAKADVNAEVLDVLVTDTFAEGGQGAPGATISLKDKIGFLYTFARNKKTQTATEWKVFADDTTTTIHKSTVSDDATTATFGEVGTGA